MTNEGVFHLSALVVAVGLADCCPCGYSGHMIDIDITIDDEGVRSFLSRMERDQIPFALSKAMNATMILAQSAVRQDAFLQAFTQRNAALPKALTTIPRSGFANKRKLTTRMENVRDGKTGRMAGEGFVERQIKGAVKRPLKNDIAVPLIGRGLARLAGGTIPSAKKPRNNKKLFRAGPMLLERQKGRKKAVPRYLLLKAAKPNRRGQFDYIGVGTRAITDNIQSQFDTVLRLIILQETNRIR